MPANVSFARIHDLLDQFDFATLFIEELGWLQPTPGRLRPINVEGVLYQPTMIAQSGGVGVYEMQAANGEIPATDRARRAAYDEMANLRAEILLIFVDGSRRRSVWYWVKHEGGKSFSRAHYYFSGAISDQSVAKLIPLFYDLGAYQLVKGKAVGPDITQVATRLREAFDSQAVVKKFYTQFNQLHSEFVALISGVDDPHDRAWYASVILNRLMFVYFLQKKGFIDGGDVNYLAHKLAQSEQRGPDRFYSEFLTALFFEGFAIPAAQRGSATGTLIGEIPYLNGGLFLPHRIEEDYAGRITIPNQAFHNVLTLFKDYTWNLNDTPGGEVNEMDPDVLGYIFEKYINQKDFGAYYTPPEITTYLAERTIHKLILDRIYERTTRRFDSVGDLLLRLDAGLCRELLDILDKLTILDPACGSGAFLVAAMKALYTIYLYAYGRIASDFRHDSNLVRKLEEAKPHPSLNYFLKKRIITNNLFGVDIMEEATEIARLRLFLTLVAATHTVADLEPLPNIDFNIMPGNSLIGLRKVDGTRMSLFAAGRAETFDRLVEERDTLVRAYRDASSYTPDLQQLRDDIIALHNRVQPELNRLLLHEFQELKIKYEQFAPNGKSSKRPLTEADIAALEPFHWGYEFYHVLAQGGFDIIITNPPWETFKPYAKEFFNKYSKIVGGVAVGRRVTDIKDFEEQLEKLLEAPDIASAWQEYRSSFPHISSYYRSSEQYVNQSAIVNGKRTGTDINYYKLFTEQCYNLLRDDGECGLVIPSGIYSDLGTTKLRQMLFSQTEITGLFCFENSKGIFENVHRSFKFVVLTFRKSGSTIKFPAAFMRHYVEELDSFPKSGGIPISVELVSRLSPDTYSVMEFKEDIDAQIAENMIRFDLLGKKLPDKWNLTLTREFDMTNDSHLFRKMNGTGMLPLFEGKMMYQFTHLLCDPKYWIQETEGRKALLSRQKDEGQILDYQSYRLAYRTVTANTNERTLIATVLPYNVFCGHSLTVNAIYDKKHQNEKLIQLAETLFVTACFNSLVCDFLIRQRVSVNMTMFYLYQLPIPRYTSGDPYFDAIVEHAAKLICTSPEYDALATEVGLGDHTAGVTDPAERAKLRAELDAMVAHIYNLSEAEFAHILTTFPLVAQQVKDATLAEYHSLAATPGDDPALVALINGGETSHVEFKIAARLHPVSNTLDGELINTIARAAACFLNTSGGTLLIGIENGTGKVIGVEREYASANPQKADHDGYTLYLTDKLGARLGQANLHLLDITYARASDHDVCRISIPPAPHAVYLDGDLYTRDAAGCKKLNAQQAETYRNTHWPR